MRHCLQCSTPVQEGQKFCSKCGASQFQGTGELVQCEACHKELPFPMPFCKWCGMAQKGYSSNIGGTTSVLENNDTTTDIINSSRTTGPLSYTEPTKEISEKDLARSQKSSSVYDDETTLVRSPDALNDSHNRDASAATLPATVPSPRRYNIVSLIILSMVAMLLGAGISYLIVRSTNSSMIPITTTVLPEFSPTPSPSTSPSPNTSPTPQPTVTPSPSPTISVTPGPSPIASPSPTNVNAPSPAVSMSNPVVTLPEGAPKRGTAEWRGTVVDSTQLVLSGRNQSVASSSPALKSSYYTIDYGLPNVPSIVSVQKKQGRGEVFVVEQPNASNGYSAHIKIVNLPEAKVDDYALAITWEVSK